jgi:transketolase
MRDAFFYRVFEHAKNNPEIMVLTSDFSAPSFDRFRTELPGQFINTGISEQNTILVAAGLAKEGKTVFVTSIAPFITMRCYEQTRLYAADMNLNIKIVAVGAGFSYNMAGATHHSVEDIGLFRMLPNVQILSPSCNSLVEYFADWCCDNAIPTYVRLDRMNMSELYEGGINDVGFNVLKESSTMIISTGYMTHTALKVAEQTDVGIMDVWKLLPNEDVLLDALKQVKRLVTVEEHIFQGGLGSYVCELLSDRDISISTRRFALDFSKGFYHRYGTRDEMHDACGIGADAIIKYIKENG